MAKEAIADDIFERLMTMLQQVLVTCYIFGAVSKAGPVTDCQNNATEAEPQARVAPVPLTLSYCTNCTLCSEYQLQ